MGKKDYRFTQRPVNKRVNDAAMIYGIRAIIETIMSGHDLEKIFILPNTQILP